MCVAGKNETHLSTIGSPFGAGAGAGAGVGVGVGVGAGAGAGLAQATMSGNVIKTKQQITLHNINNRLFFISILLIKS